MPKTPPAAEPQRRRLHPRVASYLDAATRALAEGKGDDAAGYERLARQEADQLGAHPSLEHAAIDAAIAERLRETGSPEEASERFEAALESRRGLGIEDRDSFELTYSAGVAAREAGQTERSVQLFGEAIELAGRRFGEVYLPSVPARVGLAYSLIRLGRVAEAEQALEQALSVCQRSGPPGTRASALVHEAIATVRGRSGPDPGADEQRKKAAEDMEEAERRQGRREPGDRGSRLAEELEVIEGPEEPEEPKAVLEDLDSRLVGLAGVKAEFRRLTNLLTVQAKRAEQGRPSAERRFHVVMVGPPGTGKTTVASYLGRICRSVGLLESSDVVVVSRAQLVRGHVGQTAIRTNEVIDFALDKVLFVDEAYTLAPPEAANDFGPEAIAELMLRMERDASRLVVAIAGYPREMERFLDSNSGFRSRFTDTLTFGHYEADELVEIFKGLCAANEYLMAEGSEAALSAWCERSVELRDESFGNGRAMRNLFDDVIAAQADRIVAAAKLDDADALDRLEPADFPGPPAR